MNTPASFRIPTRSRFPPTHDHEHGTSPLTIANRVHPLRPSRSFISELNDLNGAKRLNVLNGLNGPPY
jgi:hypothetical protein